MKKKFSPEAAAKLTDQRLDLEIARLCGLRVWRSDMEGNDSGGPWGEYFAGSQPLPRYSTDLNAMRAAEQACFDRLVKRKYWTQLYDLAVRLRLPAVGHWQLDARQRAEAFLLTLDDEQESPPAPGSPCPPSRTALPGSHRWNPAHPLGTCADCGGEMTYNVPRLGEAGGFIHLEGDGFNCPAPRPAPGPGISKP